MKRRLTISITFVLVLLATVAAFHRPGLGQSGNNVRRSSLNSGLRTLNQNHFVRLTLANAATNPSDGDRRTARVNVHISQYAPSGQQGSVIKYAVVRQTSSGPITLRPGEGASMDFDLTQALVIDVTGYFEFTVVAMPLAGSSDKAAATATLTVYDKLTNEPLSVWVWCEAEGGYIWMS